MARRSVATAKHRSKTRRDHKNRKASLFRKLSSKKATAEMQQIAAANMQHAANTAMAAVGLPALQPLASVDSPAPLSDSSGADSTPCSPSPASGTSEIGHRSYFCEWEDGCNFVGLLQEGVAFLVGHRLFMG